MKRSGREREKEDEREVERYRRGERLEEDGERSIASIFPKNSVPREYLSSLRWK